MQFDSGTHRRSSSLSALNYAIIIICFCIPWTAKPQGFSGPMGLGSGKTVVIKQLLPAAVNLNGKRIKIEATSAIKVNAELVNILQIKLRTMIQHDPRFIVDERNPQTILRFTITNSYIDAKHYTVGAGTNTTACTGYVGKLEVSYQALEAGNHAPLDSENLVAAITESDHQSAGNALKNTGREIGGVLHLNHSGGACGTDAKASLHEADDYLIDGIVHQMAERAAPVDEAIVVKLPGKKLEKLSRLAMSQRWATLAEEAEKEAPLPKAEDDAYRVYLIALAKEAQAYDIARESAQSDTGKRKDISPAEAEADFQKAQRLLDEARKLYKDALDAKPTEKEFLEPDTRMEKAITIYATLERHKNEYRKFAAKSTTVAVSDTKSAGSPLDQIVKYCQANMDLETITEYIKDPAFLQDARSSGYRFDFKTDPLTLNANCKDKATTIQKLMRDRLAVQRSRAGRK